MLGSPQPEDRFPPTTAGDTSAENPTAGTDRPASVGTGSDSSNGNGALGEKELDSALQLLVERAQYITGATGTALALPQGEEMVCRASAGASAPAVGARLQVRSGLTGESIARRQLLRCDNAEADPRVNLETCRALGIASIVVLPLLRRNGEVRGLFELFSDHPYAFEERDLIALERMADLTLTALDLAESRQNSAPAPTPRQEAQKPVESAAASPRPASVIPLHPLDQDLEHPEIITPEINHAKTDERKIVIPEIVKTEIVKPETDEPTVRAVEPAVISSAPVSATEPAAVPEAMRRVQKCASCGFPVSEGRTLCLDCERKDSEKKKREQAQVEPQIEPQTAEQAQSPAHDSAAPTPEEFVPAFLANSAPTQESWLANPVNLLAMIVLILGILVAVVVFR